MRRSLLSTCNDDDFTSEVLQVFVRVETFREDGKHGGSGVTARSPFALAKMTIYPLNDSQGWLPAFTILGNDIATWENNGNTWQRSSHAAAGITSSPYGHAKSGYISL